MKFISAGHNHIGPNLDPGASGVNGRSEAKEAVKMRDAVIAHIKALGFADIIRDNDGESLGQYLNRIKPGDGSVVVEFHFNAFNGKATGAEVVVGMDADRLDKAMAQDLVDMMSCTMGIVKRSGGVIAENQTHRGRLGLMRETGIVNLVEICFIDNPADMEKYDLNFDRLAQGFAHIIIKYDNLIK
jgi:N-acetylmuramoyl-L-alanine amidase